MKELLLVLFLVVSCLETLAQVPANDNCLGAIELVVNTDNLCGSSTTGTSVSATQSQVGCNFSVADDDVWYKFTATATSHKITVTALTMSDPVFEVFSETCESLVSLACINELSFPYNHTEKTVIPRLTVGEEYFIRVYASGSASFTRGTFSICIGVPVAPINDDCSNPITLNINQDQSCALTNSGTSDDATLSMVGCSLGSNADDDVWYEFTATSTVHKITLTAGTIKSPVLELFSGDCGNLTSIICKTSHNSGLRIGELQIGTKYLIRVYSYYAGLGQTGTFTLCVNEGVGMPSNDLCSGAIDLTKNTASCALTTSGTLENASGKLDVTSCVGDPIQNDVWYKFTATESDAIIKLNNSLLSNPVLELFSGTCGGLNQIKCEFGGFLEAKNLTLGEEYLLRVWNRTAVNASDATFDLCLSTSSLNDQSANAEPIAINGDFSCDIKIQGNNTFASGFGQNTNSGCGIISNGLWYKFTATNDSLEIKLNSTGILNQNMELFQNTGGNLVFLQHHSNTIKKTDFVISQEYYVWVYSCGSFFSSRGTFELCIKNIPPPPVNDNCVSAVNLSVNNDLSCDISTLGTTINALGTGNSCAGEVDDNVWYKFVATSTKHEIKVSPNSMDDATFKTYSGSCENLEFINCTEGNYQSEPEIRKLNDLIIGNTYWVEVFSSNFGTGQGTFEICVKLPLPNAECTDAINLNSGNECVPTTGSSLGVTNSIYDNCDFYKYGVWYKFTASGSSQIIRLTRGTIQNVYIDVLEDDCGYIDRIGSCGSSSNAAVIDKVVSGLTVGTTYLVWVNTVEIEEEGTFDICVLNTNPPTNDECSTAIPLTVNPSNVPLAKISGTTLFATESQTGCSGNSDDDVWYSFTATQSNHRVFLQKINTFENIVLELFSGSCGSLISMQCISFGFDETVNSSAKLNNLTIGETYFVRVYYSNSIPGDFNIAVTSDPVNDNCSVATVIIPSAQDNFANSVQGSSHDATKSSNSYQNSTITDDDVWYSFTATQKVHKIKLKGWKPSPSMGKIEVYSGDCSGLVALSCSTFNSVPYCENGSTSGDTLIFTSDKYIPGQVYSFRVFSNHISLNQSLFEVAVTSPFVLPFDDCVGALDIPVSSNANCVSSTLINLIGFSTASDQSLSCYTGGNLVQSPEKDIYLKFTATARQHKINLTYGEGGAMPFQLFSGNCGALVAQGCSQEFDSLAYFGNLIIGQTYYIRVLIYYNNLTSLNICISTPTFAINDECDGAIAVATTGDVGSCIITTGNLNNASQSQFNDCLVEGNPEKKVMRDVWYKFVATAASQRAWFSNISILKPLSGGGTETKNIKFEIYGGSCASKTLLVCSADISSQEEKIVNDLTIGDTYFIKVSSFHKGDIEFQFCIKNTSPPANDECFTSAALTVYNNWAGSNYTKGSTLDANQTIEPNICGQPNSYDVWYKFTATNVQQTIAFRNYSVQKSINGLTVAVYGGTCGSLVHISCKAGAFTSLSEDFLTVSSLAVGQEYFVKVYSSTALDTDQGDFEIQVFNPTVPPNDDCNTPFTLNIQNSSLNYTSVVTETILSTLSPEAITCTVTGTADDDVWYSFTPTQNSVRLLLSANFENPVYVLYTGTCGGLTSVVCGSAGASVYSLNNVLSNLSPDTPYLLRVFSSSNTLRGRVFVALTNDTTPPLNDECTNAVTLVPSADNIPNFTDGTTVNAKNDNTICFAGNEVWYKFVATATTHRILYDGYLKDPAIIMFSGSCTSLSFVPSTCFGGTHNIAFTKTGLIIGTTYFIKIAAQVADLENQGNFRIAIITPSVPVNDNCADALAITINAPPMFFSASLATNEASTSGCGLNSKDVWFKFTATKSKMNVEVESMNTNAIIGVYKGACPGPMLVKCSYEDTSEKYEWMTNNLNLEGLVIGDEYLINVAAFLSTSILTFKIRLYDHQDINQNSLFGGICIATNLVSNPSFENPQSCPTLFVPSPASPGQWLSPNLGWTIPTTGSSDYFNTCASFNATVEIPRNTTFGIQSPRNGEGYAGFFSGGSEYREYLHTQLSTPMEIGKRYLLSMYVSRADYYGRATNNIGFGLTVNPKVEFSSDTISVDKIILPANNVVIHEKDDWVNIVAEFTADLAYQHLYLGNFRSQSNTITQFAPDISGGVSGGYGGYSSSNNAYYFVDDVFVGEINNTIACGANDCNSNITLLQPTDNINSGIVNKNTNLTITANIIVEAGAEATFTAGKHLIFDAQNGVFEVKQGAVFEAKIGGCIND